LEKDSIWTNKDSIWTI